MAFSVLGLYLYARNPESGGAVAAGAAAFVIGLFIKQSLISFPAAVAAHLLVSRRGRSFAVWMVSMACVVGILLFVTVWWDGSYFRAHLFT